jgi:hypothetical protein
LSPIRGSYKSSWGGRSAVSISPLFSSIFKKNLVSFPASQEQDNPLLLSLKIPHYIPTHTCWSGDKDECENKTVPCSRLQLPSKKPKKINSELPVCECVCVCVCVRASASLRSWCSSTVIKCVYLWAVQ